jgi:hypothetical protein
MVQVHVAIVRRTPSFKEPEVVEVRVSDVQSSSAPTRYAHTVAGRAPVDDLWLSVELMNVLFEPPMHEAVLSIDRNDV